MMLLLLALFTFLNPSVREFSLPEGMRTLASSFYSAAPRVEKNPVERGARSKRHFKLAAFRPVKSRDVIPNYYFDKQVVQEKTTMEQIFTPELTRDMKEHYRALEAEEDRVHSPYRHASPDEEQQLESSNHNMATWTVRQAISERLHNFFNRADRDSAPMQFMRAMKTLNGGEDVTAKAAARPSAPAAPAKRGRHGVVAATQQKQEEVIPTRVKARMNVFKGQGQVNFSNPVVMMSLNADVNQIHKTPDQMNTLSVADDPVHLDMNKNFKKIDLNTNAKYGFEKRVMSVNVTKKITDQISAVASSDHFTGEQRASDGAKSQQSVRMTYSVSF